MKILFFSTPFCSNCKPLKKKLEQEGVEFEEINAITNKELVDKYGIKSVPSIVMKGNIVDHGEAYQILTGDEIKEMLGG